MKNLKNTKSVGVDGISVFVLKSCALEIAHIVTHLINKSLCDGKFPTRWKLSKVIPLFKGGDKNSPHDYRPISILCTLSKVLERVVHKQLNVYLDRHNVLSDAQSGFRPKHSTTSTLIHVTDQWFDALDKKKYTGVVFVDLKKAFDTVDHDVLLRKLEIIGIKKN